MVNLGAQTEWKSSHFAQAVFGTKSLHRFAFSSICLVLVVRYIVITLHIFAMFSRLYGLLRRSAVQTEDQVKHMVEDPTVQ